MNAHHHSRAGQRFRWLATPLLATLLMAGCVAPAIHTASADAGTVATATTASTEYGAPVISVPPTSVGKWVDLGYVRAPWLGGDAPVPVDGVNSSTRVAGLRREDGHWLAIVIAQVAPDGTPLCPQATSLSIDAHIQEACVRLRRDADFDLWLKKQHSVLYRWLKQRDLESLPRAWISTRATAGNGRVIETHALVDPTLIEPSTRNNSDFLNAGKPGHLWARLFADATKVAGSSGTLQVPPFPYGPRVAPESEPIKAAQIPKKELPVATQVEPPRPPAPESQRDRE